MVGVLFFHVSFSAFLFSFIFWLLTFLSKIFYTNKYYNYKLNFYECGFKNITKQKISYELNYVMLVLFLLIYDGEFLVLIPFAFNTGLFSCESLLVLFIFFSWLLLALFIDYAFSALEWQL